MNEFTFHSDVVHGKEPCDLPNLPLQCYSTGSDAITAACTGPDDGITIVRRSRLHLSAGPDSDIEFIDTNQEQDDNLDGRGIVKSKSIHGKTHSDQNANKHYIRPRKIQITQSSSNSVVQASDRGCSTSGGGGGAAFQLKVTRTFPRVTDKTTLSADEKTSSVIKPNKENVQPYDGEPVTNAQFNSQRNNNENRLESMKADSASNCTDGSTLATSMNWKTENEHAYGISVSLYERNHITNEPIGSPIADCFGLIVRDNCSVMALADGVNWGEYFCPCYNLGNELKFLFYCCTQVKVQN